MRFLAVSVFLFGILVACTPSTHSSSTLSNQGILALSSNNAYLGTNLYLASQAEQSNILYRFLQNRGGPTAIEIEESRFSNPRMLLYYPKDKEVYAADLDMHNGVMEWIMRGPFGIEREDFNILQRMEHSFLSEPVFVVFGKETRFRKDPALQQAHVKLEPKIPLPVATAAPKPKPAVKKPIAPVITAPKDIPPVTDFSKLNTDQQAILISQGYAERADNGDLLHTVKESESLAAITKWYTGGASAQKEIESLNSITAGAAPAAGTKVRIPVKLLKNVKAMPAGYK